MGNTAGDIRRQVRRRARRIGRATVAASSDSTFEGVAALWLAKQQRTWSKVHYTKTSRALERDVYPRLGKLPVDAITAPMITGVIEAITRRAAVETARKIRQNIETIFDYAQAKGLCGSNPAIPVKAILEKEYGSRPRPALLTFPELGGVLQRAERCALSPAVRMAHRLVAFTVARMGNIAPAQWKHFDLDGPTPMWTVPRGSMKVSKGRHFDYRALLGPTVAAELRDWQRLMKGQKHLFPSPLGKSEYISRESLEKAYRESMKLSGIHSVHGWRASFSTLAKENGFSHDAVALQLDHVHDTAVARAYDRGDRLEERVRLMYWWDTQLTAAEHGGEPMPLQAKGVA